MAWNLDRATKVKMSLSTIIGDLYSQAYHGSLTQEAELELFQARLSVLLKGAPRWLQSYAEGLKYATGEARYHRDIIFAHVAPDGTLYTAHKGANPEHFKSSDAIYAAMRGAEMSKWQSALFWNHSGKPWTTPESHAERNARHAAAKAGA